MYKNSPPKPGPQSRAICGTECTLSITNSTLLNWPIVSLLIVFYFILFSNVFLFFFSTWLYSMLYWFSLLQCWLLQLQLYTTLLYSIHLKNIDATEHEVLEAVNNYEVQQTTQNVIMEIRCGDAASNLSMFFLPINCYLFRKSDLNKPLIPQTIWQWIIKHFFRLVFNITSQCYHIISNVLRSNHWDFR